MAAAANILAKQLRSLHKPGHPLILANVYDIVSAEAVASLPACKALATASFAVARAAGTSDEDMTLETSLNAVKGIVEVAKKYGKPLTVDFQDAYGSRLEEAMTALVKLGVSGANIEDCDKETQKMHSPEVAVKRIKQAIAIAKQEGVQDFVVNARCDSLLTGGELSEVVTRGKLYLEAGATTVFVLGGKRGVTRDEIAELVKEFDGRLNMPLRLVPGSMSVKDLTELGVARISVGPQLQLKAMEYLGKEAEKILEQAI